MTNFDQQDATENFQDRAEGVQDQAQAQAQTSQEDATTDLPRVGSDEAREGFQDASEGRSEAQNGERPFGTDNAPQETKDEADRIVSDADFRAKLSFSASSVLRVVWCVFNAVMGVTLQSAWYVTLAVYYLFLSIMRGSLVRHLRGGEATRCKYLRQARALHPPDGPGD